MAPLSIKGLRSERSNDPLVFFPPWQSRHCWIRTGRTFSLNRASPSFIRRAWSAGTAPGVSSAREGSPGALAIPSVAARTIQQCLFMRFLTSSRARFAPVVHRPDLSVGQGPAEDLEFVDPPIQAA